VLNTFFRERKSSAFSLVPNPDPPLAIPPHPNPFLQDVATISWWCDRHHGVASPPAVAGAGVPPSWLACRCSVFAFVFMVSLFSVFVYCRALFFLLSPLCSFLSELVVCGFPVPTVFLFSFIFVFCFSLVSDLERCGGGWRC
jgi:hypothetical protein